MPSKLAAGEDIFLAQPFSDMEEAAQVVMLDGRPRLLGTACGHCGARSFLARQACYICGAEALATTPLAPAGTLYSFTTIHVSSHRPTPYTVGYVDLDDGARVFGPLTGDPAGLEMDGRVVLTLTPDGAWAFEREEASA